MNIKFSFCNLYIGQSFYRPQAWETLRQKRQTTMQLWVEMYPEEEFWPLKTNKYTTESTNDYLASSFTYDIFSACLRQKLFYYQVCKNLI